VAAVTVGCGLLTCLFLLFAFLSPISNWVALTAISALLTIAGGYVCPRLSEYVEQADREAASIPYVPPLFPPDTLSDTEVLIRMSQESAWEQGDVVLGISEVDDPLPSEQRLQETAGEPESRAE
jgi:hypothetical protein